MPGLHATLSPSAAKRWLSCPPSARLEQKLKDRFGDKSSSYAEEGTRLHALAELRLRYESGEINKFNYEAQRKQLGEYTKEQERVVGQYCDVVLEKLFEARKLDSGAVLLVEQRLDISPWVPECFGTGDAVIVSNKTLDVCDFKSGAGVPVYAEHNPQARLYGLGAVNMFGMLYDFDTVRNTIIQPRLDSVTEETLSKDALLEWGEEIRPTADTAWRGEGEYACGDWCQFCAARAVCAKRVTTALTVMRHGFESPDILRDEDIPGILAVVDVAEKWLKDIKDYALNQALRGHKFPGYKVVRGRRGRRQFRDPDKVIEQLARAGYTEDQYEKKELRGVNDIEKLLGKQAFTALLGDCISQADGALVVVPEDDPRAEYNSADFAFSDLGGGKEEGLGETQEGCLPVK